MDDTAHSRDFTAGSTFPDGEGGENAPPVPANDMSGHVLQLVPTQGLLPSLERKRLQAYLALLAGDVVIILATFFAVSVLYFQTIENWSLLERGMVSAYIILPLYLTIALYNGTYSRRALTDWQATSLRALVALVLSAALLNLLAFFAKSNAELSRMVFAVGLASAIVPIVLSRIGMVRFVRRRWGGTAQNRLVLLAGGPPLTLAHALHIDAGEHGSGVVEHGSTGGGQLSRAWAPGPIEEGDARRPFELPDLLADRRLCEAEVVRRSGEGPLVDDGDERRQLAWIGLSERGH